MRTLPFIAAICAAPVATQAADSPWSLHAALNAPDQLTLSGSVRIRYEAIDNQVRPGFNRDDDVLVMRTILVGEYDFGLVRVGGELWDSRAFGADSGSPTSTGEVNTFEPVSAYVAADFDFAGGDATLQAGRFQVNLGARRLVAADDYRNTTNGFTGVRADYARGDWSATALYVHPQVRLPDDVDSLLDNETRIDRDDTAAVLWGATATRKNLIGRIAGEATYLRFEEEDRPGRPTRDRRLDNYGVRLFSEPKTATWDYELEAILQRGETRLGAGPAAAKADVDAAFLHAEAGYSIDHRWKPRLSIEFEYASGDDTGGDYGRFDTLYGSRRSDLAPSGFYNTVGRANIVTPAVRLELKPSPRWDVSGVFRAMWLAADEDSFSTSGVRDPSGQSGDYAGQQIDARLRYWVVPDALRLEANGLWLIRRDVLKTAPNAPPGDNTLYGSVALTASF